MSTNEAFSRVKIDAQLKDVGWDLSDNVSVRYEALLPDGTKADYVLANRQNPFHQKRGWPAIGSDLMVIWEMRIK